MTPTDKEKFLADRDELIYKLTRKQRYIDMYYLKRYMDKRGWELNKWCINCGNLLKGRQRSWCSKECSDGFWEKHDWNSIRAHCIREHPFCIRCNIRQTEEIHHIVPISEGGDVFDRDNLMPLCYPCHLEVHAELRDAHNFAKLKLKPLTEFF